MTPAVATASVFLLLLNGNTGAINQFLGLFGIEGPQWLIDPAWVKPSIVLMTLWGVERHDGDLPRRAEERAAGAVRGGRAGRRRPVRQFFSHHRCR